jgi:hypothetical protein
MFHGIFLLLWETKSLLPSLLYREGVKSARVVLQENGLFLGIHKFILTFQRVKICPDTLSSLIAFHGKRKMALNEP